MNNVEEFRFNINESILFFARKMLHKPGHTHSGLFLNEKYEKRKKNRFNNGRLFNVSC